VGGEVEEKVKHWAYDSTQHNQMAGLCWINL